MIKTTAPRKTPSPPKPAKPHSSVGGTTKSPTMIFVSAALDMSWRLAVVVLVPIIGGFALDRRFNSSPLLSISGFILAIAGVAVVIRQMLQQVAQLPVPKKGQSS